jgi:hypothetical protein
VFSISNKFKNPISEDNMTTKIKSLAVVSQCGVRLYEVGSIINNLRLTLILDQSDEPLEGQARTIYRGFTDNKDIVFETIDAPIDVQYESD